MAQATATFEAGVQGNTILTSDTGSANAWDVATVPPTGGAMTYDNTHVGHGSLAAKLVTGNPASIGILEWTSTTLSTVGPTTAGRIYLWMAANPSLNVVTLIHERSSTNSRGRLKINLTGKIELTDSSNVVQFTSTNSITLSTWMRIEWLKTLNATTGHFEAKLFTGDSTSPVETIGDQSTNMNLGGTSMNDVLFQWGQNVSQTIWWDDMVAGAVAYPGPATSPDATVTGVRGSATATAQVGFVTVSLLGVQSAATATAQPSSANVSLLGVRATATGTAQPSSANVSLLGVRASATATAQPGSFATLSASVTGVRAASTATAQPGGFGMLSAFVGAVSTQAITVPGVRATATATAQTGGFGMLSAFVAIQTPILTVPGVRALATATAQPGVAQGDRMLVGAQAAATATAQAGNPFIPKAMGPGLAWLFMSGVYGGVLLTGVRADSTATGQAGDFFIGKPGAQAGSAATGQPGTFLLVLTGQQATSTATGRAGDFSITVTGEQAQASASIPIPGTVIRTGENIFFSGEQASATATGNAGVVLYGRLVDGAQATALATGTAGSVSTDAHVVIDGVRALSTATGQPGDSFNTIVGEQAVAFGFCQDTAEVLYDYLVVGAQGLATATAQPGRRVRETTISVVSTKAGVGNNHRYKVRVSRSAKTIART